MPDGEAFLSEESLPYIDEHFKFKLKESIMINVASNIMMYHVIVIISFEVGALEPLSQHSHLS